MPRLDYGSHDEAGAAAYEFAHADGYDGDDHAMDLSDANWVPPQTWECRKCGVFQWTPQQRAAHEPGCDSSSPWDDFLAGRV